MRHLTARRRMLVPLVWLCVGGCSTPPQAQSEAAPVDARRILAESITAMRNEALDRGRVDWTALEARLTTRIDPGAPPRDAWPLIAEAVAALNDPHARFIPPPQPPAAPTAAEQAAPSDTSAPPAPTHPPIPTVPVGNMLTQDIAYLLMPGCSAPSDEGLIEYAVKSRELIDAFARAGARHWIIDLRLNGGGDVWPMLLGLSPLLGDGVHLTSVAGGGVAASFGVTAHEAWLETSGDRAVRLAMPKRQALWDESTDPVRTLPADRRIAILIGPWTMSSGEALTIALRSTPDARTFGEPTAGLSTVTQMYTLSDGSTLILPVSVMGDRDGRAFPRGVTPDEPVRFDEWPLQADHVVSAALAWIGSTRGR